ncbi:HAD domain ookinete protein, putative [Plasmodium gaboni]|uniref:HAD domain ookinete protein, putative n=1 Tax=Plasmodium gaboni TaxID=647221 RepID=A0ABY1UPT8_9APIC|nr:HAD domain ookinete protein, putative [Plasmodium gaboni]
MDRMKCVYPLGSTISRKNYIKDMSMNGMRNLENDNSHTIYSNINKHEEGIIRKVQDIGNRPVHHNGCVIKATNNKCINNNNINSSSSSSSYGINNNVLYNKPFIYKKLIVFDYDDTILPTSWITSKMKLSLYDTIPPYINELFNKLSEVVINTLNLCSTQGKLVIVTNASLEWLINSAKKYIPMVWSFIMHKNIRIISARDTLINSLIDPKDWKKVIFHQIINEILAPYLYNTSFICFIYSVGDGNDERNACFFISQLNQYSSCIFKSLKFLSEPTCQKLIAEHELFYYFFNSTNLNASNHHNNQANNININNNMSINSLMYKNYSSIKNV